MGEPAVTRPILRVAYPRLFPQVSSTCTNFPTLRADQNCPYPGLLVEILTMIADELNMRIVAVPLGNSSDPDMSGKHINHALALLSANRVDTIAAAFQRTKQRAGNYSFTDGLYKVQTRMLMRVDHNAFDDIWDFFSTYDTWTWTAILGALIIQCIVCVFIRRMEEGMCGAPHVSVAESVWQIVRLQLLQPERVHFKSMAGKLSMFFFSLVQCAFLLGVFSTWVLSSIIRAKSEPAVESLRRFTQQLNRREIYLVRPREKNWFYEELNQSSAYPYAEIRYAIRRNPVKVVNTISEALGSAENDRGVVIVQDDDETYYHSVHYCSLVQALHNSMPEVSAHLIFHRNSPLIAPLNRVINENTVNIVRLRRKYDEARRQHKAEGCLYGESQQALSVVPYAGLCFACLIAFAIAIFILFAEITVAKCLQRRRLRRFARMVHGRRN